MGRRVRREKGSVPEVAPTNMKTKQDQRSLESCMAIVSEQQPEEKELLLFLLNQPRSLDQYVVCPSFQAEQQRSLAVQLPNALSSLKDAYLACAVTLKHLQTEPGVVVDSSISFNYISKAMNALRSLSVTCVQDAVLCHTLASTLVFSIYSAIGVGVSDVCRYCLNITSAIMDTLEFRAHEDSWESLLILFDTMDCLVYRKTPIRKMQAPNKFVVDRHLGLCLPLMPYFYDLCVISNAFLNTAEQSVVHSYRQQLSSIHAAVESWQPCGLDQLIDRFHSAEIVSLLAQAKAYRLGALLMCHRLQHPFGQEDAQAETWSKEIMMELELANRVTNRTMRFVTVPFLLAAVEARDESLRSRFLEGINYYVDLYSPSVQQAALIFLTRIWHERDSRMTDRWFDSIYKPCPVMNSINDRCFNSQEIYFV